MPSALAARYPSPWRLALVPANFRGAVFYMESVAYVGGRRIALHEYPKKDIPYAEDMGRRTRRFQIIGYLVQSPQEVAMGYAAARSGATSVASLYLAQRQTLKTVLEENSTGLLQVQQGTPDLWSMKVVVDDFSIVETKDRGGYTVFDMKFIEAGAAAGAIISVNTAQAVQNATIALNTAATASFNSQAP